MREVVDWEGDGGSDLVEESDADDGQGGVGHVVHGDEDTVVDTLGGEAAVHGEPELHEGEGEVLVEEVAQEEGHPVVGPVSVDEQQSLQVVELGDAVVAVQHSLHALVTLHPDPYVGLFDHADVIGPVPYGQSDGVLVRLHPVHNQRLLPWGHPAADHSVTLTANLQKQVFHSRTLHLWGPFPLRFMLNYHLNTANQFWVFLEDAANSFVTRAAPVMTMATDFFCWGWDWLELAEEKLLCERS